MGWPLGRLAEICGAETGAAPDTEVLALCTPDSPVLGGLGYAATDAAARALEAGGALVLAASGVTGAALLHPDPKGAFAALVSALSPPQASVEPGVHPRAVVAESAEVHPQAAVGPLCFVGEGAVVGEGCSLHAFSYLGDRSVLEEGARLLPHAVVMEDCVIGRGAVVGPGTIVGAQGFGLHGSPRARLPHRGGVRLGDEAWLGANNTVDAGLLDPTEIEAESQTDGLVHVAHNVRVGKRAALAAQTGIAGSSRLGDDVTAGGQVGIADHLEVASGTVLGGGSSLLHSERAEGRVLLGYPAREKSLTMRIWAALKRLPDLFRGR